MKIKNYSLKILSMAISLMMLLSVASIPAMAVKLEDAAYSKTGIANGNGLTLDAFKALYDNAQYAAVETFENPDAGTFTPKTSTLDTKASISFYPIIGEDETPVTGEENSCSLELTRGDTYVFKFLGALTNTSSGTGALQIDNITKGLTFSIGEIANNRALKPVAFGWALAGASSSASNFSINVKYSDNSSEKISIALKKLADHETQFVGFKAPEGAFITDINIPAESTVRNAYVDDIAIIFGEFSAPEEITVTTEADTVAEPQYNATKTVQFVARDAKTNNEYKDVNWSVTGTGATIDENGLVTLKRTEDTSIAGEITVTAKVKSDETIFATKTITVTAADPYFESSKMSDGAVTSYTKDDFVADLNAAEHKAVINLENRDEYTSGSGNIAFSTAVSGNGGTFGCTLQTCNQNGTASTTTPSVRTGYIRLSTRNTKDNSGYYAINLDGEKLTDSSIKPTAVGLMLGNSGGNHNCFVRIYLDGESNPIAYSKAFSDANKNDFVGYKAPGGRYIERIELETSASSDFDDLCFIFENPEEAPIKFSTDSEATDIIGSLADVEGDIYINVASRTTFAGNKVLLALFGGDELLDVAMVDASETETVQTMASIPTGKTLTKVKAFVWNFNGLVPSQNDIIIDK